jgi:hypothetical protein
MAELDLHDVVEEIENRGFSIDTHTGYLLKK